MVATLALAWRHSNSRRALVALCARSPRVDPVQDDALFLLGERRYRRIGLDLVRHEAAAHRAADHAVHGLAQAILARVVPRQEDERRGVPRRNGVATAALVREYFVDRARQPRALDAQQLHRGLHRQRLGGAAARFEVARPRFGLGFGGLALSGAELPLATR